jgi:hypothetical protein
MVSCYETIDKSIVCFYKYFQTSYAHYAFYAYNPIKNVEKNKDIYTIDKDNKDEKRFFKCVHYTLEIGAFVFYNDDKVRRAIIVFFEFKSTTGCTPSDNKIEFDSYDFNYNYLLNDMVKLSEGKIFFAAVSIDKKSLYIVSIFKFGEIDKDYFIERIYHINSFTYNDYSFNDTIRLTIFNNYLSLCSNLKPKYTFYTGEQIIFDDNCITKADEEKLKIFNENYSRILGKKDAIREQLIQSGYVPKKELYKKILGNLDIFVFVNDNYDIEFNLNYCLKNVE